MTGSNDYSEIFYTFTIFSGGLFHLHSPFKIKTYSKGSKTISSNFVLPLEIGFSLLFMINHVIGIENISLSLVTEL